MFLQLQKDDLMVEAYKHFKMKVIPNILQLLAQ